MDAVLEEICRARGPQDIRPDVLKRWQRYLAEVVAPALEATSQADTHKPSRPRREDATHA